jgi:hypothetical protein
MLEQLGELVKKLHKTPLTIHNYLILEWKKDRKRP